MSQRKKIKEILLDYQKHCSIEFVEKVHLIDYRARISSLRKEGLNILSEPCLGKCGRNHTSSVHRYWIECKIDVDKQGYLDI